MNTLISSPTLFSSQVRFTHSRKLRFIKSTSHKVNTPKTNRTLCVASNSKNSNDLWKSMEFSSWAPELINGRCAMMGFVSGFGYESITGESLYEQAHEFYPYFLILSLLITIATFKAGPPTEKDDNRVPGFTRSAELFNGRVAMLGITGSVLYEIINNLS